MMNLEAEGELMEQCRRIPWVLSAENPERRAKEAAQRGMARYEREMKRNWEIVEQMMPEVIRTLKGVQVEKVRQLGQV